MMFLGIVEAPRRMPCGTVVELTACARRGDVSGICRCDDCMARSWLAAGRFRLFARWTNGAEEVAVFIALIDGLSRP